VQTALRQQLDALGNGAPLVVAGVPVVATDLLPGPLRPPATSSPPGPTAAGWRPCGGAVQTSELHGLEPADYRMAAIERAAEALRTGAAATPDEQARLDIALTDSLAQLLTHLRHGKTDPLRFYADWKITAEDGVLDLGAELTAVLQSGDVRGAVDRALPTYPPYQRLVKALAEYRALQAGAGCRPSPPATRSVRARAAPGCARSGRGCGPAATSTRAASSPTCTTRSSPKR